MNNKEYTILLTNEARAKQAELLKSKPQQRNLNIDNYNKALTLWNEQYNELEARKRTIFKNYKEGTIFIQF